MTLLEHAKRELGIIYKPEDLKGEDNEINKAMYDDILKLIKVFSKQGHSGFSARYCLDVFYKLAKFECLTHLTDDPEEWEEVESNCDGTDKWYQSKRQSNCFSWDLEYSYCIDEPKIPKWKKLFVKNFKGMKLHKLKPKPTSYGEWNS